MLKISVCFLLLISIVYNDTSEFCPGYNCSIDPFGYMEDDGIFSPNDCVSLLTANGDVPYPKIGIQKPQVSTSNGVAPNVYVVSNKKVHSKTENTADEDGMSIDETAEIDTPKTRKKEPVIKKKRVASRNAYKTEVKKRQTTSPEAPSPIYIITVPCDQKGTSKNNTKTKETSKVSEENHTPSNNHSRVSPTRRYSSPEFMPTPPEGIKNNSKVYGMHINDLKNACVGKLLDKIKQKANDFKYQTKADYTRSINSILENLHTPMVRTSYVPENTSENNKYLKSSIESILEKNKCSYNSIYTKNMTTFKENLISLLIDLSSISPGRIAALLRADDQDFTFYDDLDSIVKEINTVETENRKEELDMNIKDINKLLNPQANTRHTPYVQEHNNMDHIRSQLLDLERRFMSKFEMFEAELENEIKIVLKGCMEEIKKNPLGSNSDGSYYDYPFESSGYIRLYV
ncbi:hypothetical protein SLOPH_762 [Spraguea lophii 42_110]|uniref:Uncharacterized protein n=1 Tax=Spraguea lophii (strain 42_110) TaxID=1358809 RepID=S7XKC8_SPRLO|nr:hypothetical protein SLOPH_762 [Spraguea lophii 42_110]